MKIGSNPEAGVRALRRYSTYFLLIGRENATSSRPSALDIKGSVDPITLDRGPIGEHYGQEGPESHRQARRQSRAHAPHDAVDEPGKARWRTGSHLPAGAEIREGNQPNRGQSVGSL